jgi:hypothetical protein
VALKEKMVPSETVMAPNAKRGRKLREEKKKKEGGLRKEKRREK